MNFVQKREVLGAYGGVDGICVFFRQFDETVYFAVVIVEVYDGLQEAHADTSGNAEFDVVRVVFAEQFCKTGIDCSGTCCKSAAAFTYQEFHASAPPSSSSFRMVRSTCRALSGVRVL